MSRYLLVAFILLVYAVFCYLCWWRFQRRQARLLSAYNTASGTDVWLVAYASQGGNAQTIAEQTAQQLQQAGKAIQLIPLNHVTPSQLQHCAGALLVVSTYGEGEAPDNGNRFISRLDNLSFSSLQYAVLALGDSSYRHFCAFGHAVHVALHQQGATALGDLIEVDQRDASALRHWQYHLGQLTGQHNFEDWLPVEYQPWTLAHRQCLNPGSPGLPAFRVQLVPGNAQWLNWQAGDIVEIGPGNSRERLNKFFALSGIDSVHLRSCEALLQRKRLPVSTDEIAGLPAENSIEWIEALPDLPHREYSIASLPQEGHLDLLVRQTRDEQGELGLGSGWLTAHAQLDDQILLRVRSNPRFHPPADGVPLILIGNGTGIAGLRAHLRWRATQGQQQNWLLFGERTRAADFFFGEDIQQWQQSGFIAHLDVAFSRDADSPARYVQDLVRQHAERLRDWVENQQAAIYICGSLQGMAQGVETELEMILGKEALELLAENGRYCRDVY
ncbi:sulfite reductase subunit alpha [Cellvibrio polysaccharolyticus]|uniref:NADPH--hemoprotein reductase n=1 Tax=Cellvibrio polysaccharolyticus TaxID=2082724 RepID=A0A928YUB7_9GAMM|nr:sulfite reductase subunit alpha [Cellvibrio polysaccharolyticus]MBE8717777.1 sulfite reductase subunit alpha [Cellvibrio polysaccharolyticus]